MALQDLNMMLPSLLGCPVSLKTPNMGNTGLENQGFVVAFDIRHATELIDANPIGFALPVGEGG